MNNKPLLSLCIPTNGIMYLIQPVIESIYSEEVDESLFEVIIMDNGDSEIFHDFAIKVEKNHTNFHYYKTDKKGFLNEFESYKKANGEFIKFVNHRTKIVPGTIDYLLDFVRNNRKDRPAIYFTNNLLNFNKTKHLKTFDEYVYNLGITNTWSTGMAFWKSDFVKLNLDNVNELFPHTNILFGIRDKKEFIIDNREILDEIEIDAKNKGRYDLYYAFAYEFNNITHSLLEKGYISKNTFNKVKKDLLVFFRGLFVYFNLRHNPCSYDISNYIIIGKYYSLLWFYITTIFCITQLFINKVCKIGIIKKKEDKHFIYDKPVPISLRFLHRKLAKRKQDKKYRNIIKRANNSKVEKKYYTSICGIFKNESPYLKEWLEYHLIIGIDHFYMYNNNSEDNFLPILKPYIDKGIVTLIDWKRNQAQMEAYNDCINRFKNETTWLGFIDINEFILPIEGVEFKSFLSSFEDKAGSILLYWKFFGANNIDKRDITRPVIKDFNSCWDRYSNTGKCFYNTNYGYRYIKDHKHIHHHFWSYIEDEYIPPMNVYDNFSYWDINKVKDGTHPIQINHYFTKSKSEYVGEKV